MDETRRLRCDGCGDDIHGDVHIRGGKVLCGRCARPAAVTLDEVTSAQLTLASATNRRLRTEEVVPLCGMLAQLSAAVQQYRKVARRLTEARQRGNPVDMWRAIGEIEGLVDAEVEK